MKNQEIHLSSPDEETFQTKKPFKPPSLLDLDIVDENSDSLYSNEYDDFKDAGLLYSEGFDVENPVSTPKGLAEPGMENDYLLQSMGLAVLRLQLILARIEWLDAVKCIRSVFKRRFRKVYTLRVSD